MTLLSLNEATSQKFTVVSVMKPLIYINDPGEDNPYLVCPTRPWHIASSPESCNNWILPEYNEVYPTWPIVPTVYSSGIGCLVYIVKQV